MENLDFIIILLMLLVIVLFIFSRGVLANIRKSSTRKDRLGEMIRKVWEYDRQGKGKYETIEKLMQDFNLGKREAAYLLDRAMKEKEENR
ncbi:hypothetical protein [Salinicoccus carnicancri]|uniref:hypothetical protein n=1 Tax=Salinicoccus carnicancri TaxID=558170 RepID=UPI00030719B6|nr:hypothetical protein [Salinicoccus carnicancri]